MVICGVIYMNIAALLYVSSTRIDLPNHWVTLRLFSMFNLFDRWSTQNYGFEIRALVDDTTDDEPAQPRVIDPYLYFPQTRGEANRRLNMLSYGRHQHRKDKAYQELIEDIRRLHQREHPQDVVERMHLIMLQWPADPAGHEAGIEYAKHIPLAEG